jgi:NitT/TauT family transport system substrate-binding protein
VRAQGLEKLRIGAVPTDDMTPIFWAIKSGLYQKEGLDVEVVTTNSGSASTAAVVGGAYELGKASPVASLLARQRGLPLTIIANGALSDMKSNYNQVVVPADSPIRRASDCNGKVGAAPGLNDTAQFGLMIWVDKNGGDSSTMHFVELPTSATAAALAGHRIDVSTLNEPNLTPALANGQVRALGNAHHAIGDRWVSAVYLARPDWAKSHPDVIRRWVRATYQSAIYANAHENETIPVMAEMTKIPAATYAKMARIPGCETSDPALLQPVIDFSPTLQGARRPGLREGDVLQQLRSLPVEWREHVVNQRQSGS